MPYALCPMPYARLSSVHLMLLRKAIHRLQPAYPIENPVSLVLMSPGLFEQL